jgi:hypothetical protein
MRNAIALLLLLVASAEAKDLSKCVKGWRGDVDMKCLGGKSQGTSALRVASSGQGGAIARYEPTLHSVLPGIRDCHEAAIARKGRGIEGSIALRVPVDGEGKPGTPDAQVEGLTDATLVGCIKQQFASLRFARPESGAGRVKLTLELTIQGTAAPRTLADDARAMCAAAAAMREAGWHAGRSGVLSELATRFADSQPSPAGAKIVDGLATTPKREIPAAWRKALVAGGVTAAEAACPALDALLAKP